MDSSEENPYEAPRAIVRDRRSKRPRARLASRLTRLGAQLLDGVFSFLAMLPALITMFAGDPQDETMSVVAILVGAIAVLCLFIYNLVLLSRNGWTLGKKLCGIRIVRSDFSDAGLARIFWLRMVVNGLLGLIPVLGTIYSLADPLFIFSDSRRCIHDHIADTVVIEA